MHNGQLAFSNQEKANLLANHFQSVYVKSTTNSTEILNSENTRNLTVDFSPYIIYETLRRLPNKTTDCPDFVNQFVLKNCAIAFALPLSLLFTESFQSGDIPSQWKKAYVSAIHKKGSRSNPDNYRPISITSAICRAMEKILAYRIRLLFIDRFSPKQYGFLPKRSCNAALIDVISSWNKKLKFCKSLDVIYFDFQKAFDKVNHEKLLDKLQKFGFDLQTTRWFKHFLSNRVSFVKIENYLSSEIDINSGVLQGTVTGPLLFLIYINDIHNTISSESDFCLFADDLKIYGNDSKKLQTTINKIYDWSITNSLPLAKNKINTLHLGTRNSRHQYTIGNEPISAVPVMRDLGVLIDEKLTFENHIITISNKAQAVARRILATFYFADPKQYMKLFNTYVAPILMYCSEIFAPAPNSNLASIMEQPLRTFTKEILQRSRIEFNSYPERLTKLNEKSIFHRCVINDMNQVLRIITQRTYLPFPLFKLTPLPRHPCRIIHQSACIYPNWFEPRAIKRWNKLAPRISQISSFTSLKNLFDNTSLDIFLENVPRFLSA